MIKVNDPIYGSHELPDVFKDLLDSKAMQRLGNIHHSGAIFLVNPDICHTRLEHSIGVMLLIKCLVAVNWNKFRACYMMYPIRHSRMLVIMFLTTPQRLIMSNYLNRY